METKTTFDDFIRHNWFDFIGPVAEASRALTESLSDNRRLLDSTASTNPAEGTELSVVPEGSFAAWWTKMTTFVMCATPWPEGGGFGVDFERLAPAQLLAQYSTYLQVIP